MKGCICISASKVGGNAKKTKFLLIRGKNDKKWAKSSVNIAGEQVTESISEVHLLIPWPPLIDCNDAILCRESFGLARTSLI
jgi:hypothetical protein